MLIFRGPIQSEQDFVQQSADQMQASMEKWNAWIGKLAQNGKFDGGQPLLPEGKVLRGSARKLTDGPFMEGKEIVGGYFLIKADDFEDAVNIAKECPSFEENADSTVEIREIMILPS